MKAAGIFFLTLALSSSGADQTAQPATPPPAPPAAVAAAPAQPVITTTTSESITKPSAQLTETLTALLPKYNPPPPPPPETPPDPDVLVLEKQVVTGKKRPRLGEEDLMRNKAFNAELTKKFTTPLDRTLNALSLGGQSAAERAREEYEYHQRQQLLQDVATIARAVEISDPAQAKALRDAAAKP